eukprot:3003128-Pyramimonas_sp.AAC.1
MQPPNTSNLDVVLMLLIGATIRRGHCIRNRWIRNPGSRSQWTLNCGSAMGIAADPERAQAALRPR